MKTKRGFTIIELLITIVVLSFGIIGIYSAFYPVLTSMRTISSRLTAAYLAQEGIEIVRNIRDTNFLLREKNHSTKWSDGLLGCELGCYGDYETGTSPSHPLQPYHPNDVLHINSNGLYSYEEGQETLFARKIAIHVISADILKVVVSVAFNSDGKQSQFEIEEYLYNYE